MTKMNDRPGMAAENRIGIIIDKLPGFDRKAAYKFLCLLEDKGYNVKTFSIEEFCTAINKPQGGIDCAIMIIPNAASFPAHCAVELKAYAERGGQLLVLGGALFNRLVKLVDGQYQDCDYPKNCLDATFSGEMKQVIIEGFSPVYKLYSMPAQTRFMTEPDQFVFSGKVCSKDPLDVICPVSRPHGQGYNQQRKTRYVPLVQCMGSGGRAGGHRGAAAFFMLNDSFDYPLSLGGTRPNSVGCSIVGSATAGIGFTEQQLLNISGAQELFLGIIDHLLQGLFLFEGGCDCFVHRVGEELTFGAKILNTRQDYLPVKLCFTVSDAEKIVLRHEADTLAGPRNISDCHFLCPVTLSRNTDYKVKVTLVFADKVIDQIEHDILALTSQQSTKDDFIRVKDDNFVLKGKLWYPVGMNYWPHFFAGVEEVENWYGWLSDKYYDPLEVERDLTLLEENGFNFLITRLDGNIFEHSITQLLDFLERCHRHGIYVGLGWPEAMSPFYYNKEAVAKLFEVSGIHNDPTVFCYDIIWEMGGVPLIDKFRPYWDEPWRQWIVERYGSIENAENDWNFPANRNEQRQVIAPHDEQLKEDGSWRIMVAAYRRFMDDFLSQKWNEASRDIRRCAPNQLLTYRMGHVLYNNVSFTATGKHVDFMAPEGYDFDKSDDGFNASCFASRFLDFAGNGKPIVWVEFGMSLIGNVYAGQLMWDRKNLKPLKGKFSEQNALLCQFYEMIIASGCNGLAPWWWSGGVRRKEISDFGLIEPGGGLRPGIESLIKMIPELTRERYRPEPEEWFEFDRDVHAAAVSRVCYGSGRDAYAAAAESGKTLGVRTAGTGTDSGNVPLVAIGNNPYNGSNPLKYLNAEFNEVVLSDNAGNTWQIYNGGTVMIPRGIEVFLHAEVGNTQEAKWLAPASKLKEGGVYLVSASDSDIAVRCAVSHDVGRFEDTVIGPVALGMITGTTKLCLNMEAEKRGNFGQVFSCRIIPQTTV